MMRRELSDDIMESTDATTSEAVELLQRLKIGEYWEESFPNKCDTSEMMRYVNRLKEQGLDIGKGDSQFGYKMPLSEKSADYRALRIFRRN